MPRVSQDGRRSLPERIGGLLVTTKALDDLHRSLDALRSNVDLLAGTVGDLFSALDSAALVAKKKQATPQPYRPSAS